MFRKKKPRKKLTISTAALPDIVFMLLFFFMVSTVMRENTLKVKLEMPQVTSLEKLKDKALTATIFIGKPIANDVLGDVERIQIDDHIISLKEVGDYILAKKQHLPPKLRYKFRTVIKADKNAKMKIISQVKEELKLVNILKIQYACITESPQA